MSTLAYLALTAIGAATLGAATAWRVMAGRVSDKRTVSPHAALSDVSANGTHRNLHPISRVGGFCRLVLCHPLQEGQATAFVIQEGGQTLNDLTMTVTDLAKLDRYANPGNVTVHGFANARQRYRFDVVPPGYAVPVEGLVIPFHAADRVRLLVEFSTRRRRFAQQILIDTGKTPWSLAQRVQKVRSDGSFATVYEHIDEGYPVGPDNTVHWN